MVGVKNVAAARLGIGSPCVHTLSEIDLSFADALPGKYQTIDMLPAIFKSMQQCIKSNVHFAKIELQFLTCVVESPIASTNSSLPVPAALSNFRASSYRLKLDRV